MRIRNNRTLVYKLLMGIKLVQPLRKIVTTPHVKNALTLHQKLDSLGIYLEKLLHWYLKRHEYS